LIVASLVGRDSGPSIVCDNRIELPKTVGACSATHA